MTGTAAGGAEPATAKAPVDELVDVAEGGQSGSALKLLSALDYGRAADVFFWNAIEFVARASDRLYAVMSKHTIRGDMDGVTVEIEGKTVESPMVPIAYEIPISYDDVRNTNLVALNTAIHTAAMSKLEQVATAYNDYIDAATDAVGHNVQLTKDNYNWNTVLDLLEKVEWAEGTDGQVHAPQQLTGANVPPLPEMTAEQELRLQKIALEKQEEHVARRRSRRLR